MRIFFAKDNAFFLMTIAISASIRTDFVKLMRLGFWIRFWTFIYRFIGGLTGITSIEKFIRYDYGVERVRYAFGFAVWYFGMAFFGDWIL